MKYFSSAKDAGKEAQRLGLVGLTGSGQICGPVITEDGWYYHTAHSAYGGEPYGSLVFADEVVPWDGEENGKFDIFTRFWDGFPQAGDAEKLRAWGAQRVEWK